MTNYNEADLRKRFRIERDEWRPDGIDCEHPLCERFHANGCPEPGLRVEYVIIDTVTGNRAECDNWAETYTLRRDAKATLDRWIKSVLEGTARDYPSPDSSEVAVAN